jgi:dipeptidyl aminopeptidase/acylaminoacyl peptidase
VATGSSSLSLPPNRIDRRTRGTPARGGAPAPRRSGRSGRGALLWFNAALPVEPIMSSPLPRLAMLGLLCACPPVQAATTDTDALSARVEAMARIGSASAPQYSPDGSQIAFITNLSGLPQLWLLPAEGGYPRQVTGHEDPVGGARWSPDGRLAYAVSPGGGYNARLHLVDVDGTGSTLIAGDGSANVFAGDFADDGRYHFRSNARSADSTDAWLFDPATGEGGIAVEVDGLGGIADLRDGTALVWRLVTRGNNNLYLRDLASGEELLLTPHTGPAQVSGRFGAQADTIYLAHNLDRDDSVFARIGIGADGTPSAPETLAERAGSELDEFVLSRDRRQALLLWNVAGRSELEHINLDNGTRRPLPPAPAELVGRADFAPDGGSLVLALAGSTTPSDLWRLDLVTGDYERLTWSPHPGVDLARMVRPELHSFSGHDELPLTGWLYLPPGFESPGPVVLSFHGGPEGQERPAFRADYQALLAAGIAVFAPNIRGSSGFGKAFMQMDNHAGRRDANRDIKAAADFLVGAGIGQPGRLGIMGGSYGGYVVMVAMTDYPETFAAGANLFGIVNFETFFAHSTPWMGAISTGEYGDPTTQAELLRELSPIHKLDQVRSPLLVMHGANDTNVPVVEAEQVVERLRARGVEVEYVLFPDEGHGWRKQANRVRSTVELVRFFARHLAAGAPAPAGGDAAAPAPAQP